MTVYGAGGCGHGRTIPAAGNRPDGRHDRMVVRDVTWRESDERIPWAGTAGEWSYCTRPTPRIVKDKLGILENLARRCLVPRHGRVDQAGPGVDAAGQRRHRPDAGLLQQVHPGE